MRTHGVCVIALACCAGPAAADIVVYGVSDIGLDTSQLFTLNVTTGTLNLIGDAHPGADIEGITILQLAGGAGEPVIVGHTGDDGQPHDFVDLDFTSGALTVLGPVDTGSDEFKGLGSAGDGTIWGFVENQGWGTVDGSGAFNQVHSSNLMIESVAVTSDGETLYGTTDDGRLYQVDAVTGNTTLLTTFAVDDDVENLEMLSDTEVAFFTEGPGGVTFNVYNVITGAHDQTMLQGVELEDIETFVIIPTPGSLALLMLAGLATRRRRRH